MTDREAPVRLLTLVPLCCALALSGLAAQAAPMVPAVVQKQQQRFLERWAEALESAGAGNAVTADSAGLIVL